MKSTYVGHLFCYDLSLTRPSNRSGVMSSHKEFPPLKSSLNCGRAGLFAFDWSLTLRRIPTLPTAAAAPRFTLVIDFSRFPCRLPALVCGVAVLTTMIRGTTLCHSAYSGVKRTSDFDMPLTSLNNLLTVVLNRYNCTYLLNVLHFSRTGYHHQHQGHFHYHF